MAQQNQGQAPRLIGPFVPHEATVTGRPATDLFGAATQVTRSAAPAPAPAPAQVPVGYSVLGQLVRTADGQMAVMPEQQVPLTLVQQSQAPVQVSVAPSLTGALRRSAQPHQASFQEGPHASLCRSLSSKFASLSGIVDLAPEDLEGLMPELSCLEMMTGGQPAAGLPVTRAQRRPSYPPAPEESQGQGSPRRRSDSWDDDDDELGRGAR